MSTSVPLAAPAPAPRRGSRGLVAARRRAARAARVDARGLFAAHRSPNEHRRPISMRNADAPARSILAPAAPSHVDPVASRSSAARLHRRVARRAAAAAVLERSPLSMHGGIAGARRRLRCRGGRRAARAPTPLASSRRRRRARAAGLSPAAQELRRSVRRLAAMDACATRRSGRGRRERRGRRTRVGEAQSRGVRRPSPRLPSRDRAASGSSSAGPRAPADSRRPAAGDGDPHHRRTSHLELGAAAPQAA